MTTPDWQYDEFTQLGTDYESIEEVKAYDRRMRNLRDVAAEAEEILGLLEVGPESVVLEIGCGTGEFSITAAARCAGVYAVDISEPMLECARGKAASLGIENVDFRREGYLTFDSGVKVDAVVTQLALHHLPDYWKAVALTRIWDALKNGGRLFIRDVVFPGEVKSHKAHFQYWLAGAKEIGGDELREEAARHIKCEHSTTDWIMEGLIRNAGFSIVRADYSGLVFATYLCAKRTSD